jgi:hypothetical protein
MDPGAAGNFFALHRPYSKAAWCAEFSRLTYGDFATALEPTLSDIGFKLIAAPFDRDGTQGFLAEGPDFTVLAFRGSDDVAAWATNLNALPASPRPWTRSGPRSRRPLRAPPGLCSSPDTAWARPWLR